MAEALTSADVPQANRVELIRRVVEVVAAGVGRPAEIGRNVPLSPRHTSYYVSAARILGWVEAGPRGSKLTEAGRLLLHTKPGSAAERRHLAEAMASSQKLKETVGDLLQARIDREDLVERLVEKTGLSAATAARRASALMRWRRFALGKQRPKKRRGRRRRKKTTTRQADVAPQVQAPVSSAPTVESEVERVLAQTLSGPDLERVLTLVAWTERSSPVRDRQERDGIHALAEGLRRRRQPLQRLKRALRTVAQMLPAHEDDVVNALIEAELLRPSTTLRAVAEAGKLLGFRVTFTRDPADPGYLLSSSAAEPKPAQSAEREVVIVRKAARRV